MEKTRTFVEVSEFVSYNIKPRLRDVIGREPVSLTHDVELPQIAITYGELEDKRILVTFHVGVENGGDVEIKQIVARLEEMITAQSAESQIHMYPYGSTPLLHPTLDGKPFLQKLCHYAGRRR